MAGIATVMRLAGQIWLTFWPQSALAKSTAWRNLVTAGLSACRSGNYAEAEKQFGSAPTAAEKFWARDRRLAMTLNNIARLRWSQDDHSGAEQFQTRALKIFEEIKPPHDPDVIRARFNLSQLYHGLRRFDEAERLLTKVLAVEMHALSFPGTVAAEVFARLAAIYLDRGQLDKAEAFSHEALLSWEMILGSDHPDVAGRIGQLVTIYMAQGRRDEAEALRNRERQILADVSSLIDQMLAELDLSEDSREELRGYRQNIETGEFDEADWRYLQAFIARLSKRR